jgi:hypothetical protein
MRGLLRQRIAAALLSAAAVSNARIARVHSWHVLRFRFCI